MGRHTKSEGLVIAGPGAGDAAVSWDLPITFYWRLLLSGIDWSLDIPVSLFLHSYSAYHSLS